MLPCGQCNLGAFEKCTLPGFMFEVVDFIARVMCKAHLLKKCHLQRSNIEVEYVPLSNMVRYGGCDNNGSWVDAFGYVRQYCAKEASLNANEFAKALRCK